MLWKNKAEKRKEKKRLKVQLKIEWFQREAHWESDLSGRRYKKKPLKAEVSPEVS